MKRFKITYNPFEGSDIKAEDVTITADDEKQAKEIFMVRHPMWNFVSAKEEI